MRIPHTNVPYFLQYEVSYVCQAKCFFCYNPTRKAVTPPIEKIHKIVDSIKEAEVPNVQLIGGEVTLLQQLNEIIDSLSEVSGVTIVTNGIKKVNLSSNLLGMFISLHGSNSEIHEKQTTTPGTYEKICSHIREYVLDGIDVSADVLLSSINYSNIYNIIAKAYDLGMQRVYINRFEPGGIGSSSTEKLMPNLKQFKEALTQIIQARKDFGMPVELGVSMPLCADERLMQEELAFNCGAGQWFGAINPDGDLRICNQSIAPIGNVIRDSIVKLWNSDSNKYLEAYRNLIWVEEPCNNCPVLDLCVGGCRIDATCNDSKVAQIDYYIKNLGIKPDFESLKIAKERYLTNKNVIRNNELKKQVKINPHMRLLENSNGNFIVNQIVGVAKISPETHSIVREIQLDNRKIDQLTQPSKMMLQKIGVLI